MEQLKCTLCYLLLLLSTTYLARGAPALATDVFKNPCGFIEDPIAPQSWSDPATWPNNVVPGIGAQSGINVLIPCNKVVIMDVANLTVGTLRIQGLLKFLDDPSLPLIYLKANHILVEGQLFIGTAAQPFRQKATIELTPSLNRETLKYTFSAPADPANPRNLGHKAFAVVGGQVRLYGLPGPSNMPVWVKLSRDAKDKDTIIQVDADVAGMWPIGGEIVITSSDYDANQAEKFIIVNVSSTGQGQSVIGIDQPLKYKHYGTINGIPDGFGGFVDERAEVMLLTRNIVITGTDEPAPYHLEGGHFMIFQTNYPPQYIEGVEFYKMGQQGILGRYSIHFHILGSTPETVCRKNSIHQSKQRCIVVHATHGLTLDSNVAYNTSGHCFMLEEGGEENNTFVNNVGALTRRVTKPIASDETDNKPSTFWITNLKNSFTSNVAAGSDDSGFWFELRDKVRGASLKIPGLNTTVPMWGTITLFLNNTAHSNADAGLRTYPNGMRPRVDQNTYGVTNVLHGVRSYKNVRNGLFVHNTDSLEITNSIFADNGWGIQFTKNDRITVRDSVFSGQTNNLGNPSKCWDSSYFFDCRPADPGTCKMPLAAGVPGRSTGGLPWDAPSFGIVADQGGFWDYWPYIIKNVKFSNFDNTCSMSSALLMVGNGHYWNAGYTVEGLEFTDNTLPVWAVPRIAKTNFGAADPLDHGEQTQFHMMYDKDGSFNGGKDGYLVTNNTDILPPNLSGCTPRPSWNAYTCTGVCYRSVWISYPEPNFVSKSSDEIRSRSSYSYLQVTRVSDGKVLSLDGNLQENKPASNARNYVMNLLGNQSYRVEIMAPPSSPTFSPENITVKIADYGACGQGLTLMFKQQANRWMFTPSTTVFYRMCSGVEMFTSNSSNIQMREVCTSNIPWLEAAISAGINNIPETASMKLPQLVLFRSPASSPVQCLVQQDCSAIWSGTSWSYDDSGLERRPEFYNPVVVNPSQWKSGLAPLGNTLLSSWTATPIPAYNQTYLRTFYFRKTFSLSSASCYSALNIDIANRDGVIVYLNNVEVLRSNMAPGYVDNRTHALRGKLSGSWEYFSIPINSSSPYFLVDGTNTIAVEEHAERWGETVLFEMRMSLLQVSSTCNRAQTPRTEICDGLDNDKDGKADNKADGALLTAPCTTACGSGFMTCINGYFQKCTAVVPQAEICDGKDNDCDGLIDNGNDQLDCAMGQVCYEGKCIAAVNATSVEELWGRNATKWNYNDMGVELDSSPSWRTGNLTGFLVGDAPLGYDYRVPVPAWQKLITNISMFSANGRSLTAYFTKSFNLDKAQLEKTFNLDFNVRRVDGVVVYLNGVEIWRDNLNLGNIRFNNASRWNMQGERDEMSYWVCKSCRRNNSAHLKLGTNYIAAEVHMSYFRKPTSAFDLQLIRNAIVDCPASATNCVRTVEQGILEPVSVWRYADGSMEAPSQTSWMTTKFDDSNWLTGTSPLGYNRPGLNTRVNNGSVGGSELSRSLYFRKWITVPEASCYVSLRTYIMGKDGFALYINGVEATRAFVPDPLNSTAYANGSHWTWMQDPYNLTGGWLKPGENLIAAEVHRLPQSNSLAFDLRMSGLREGVTCLPDPENVAIPWTFNNVRY